MSSYMESSRLILLSLESVILRLDSTYSVLMDICMNKVISEPTMLVPFHFAMRHQAFDNISGRRFTIR